MKMNGAATVQTMIGIAASAAKDHSTLRTQMAGSNIVFAETRAHPWQAWQTITTAEMKLWWIGRCVAHTPSVVDRDFSCPCYGRVEKASITFSFGGCELRTFGTSLWAAYGNGRKMHPQNSYLMMSFMEKNESRETNGQMNFLFTRQLQLAPSSYAAMSFERFTFRFFTQVAALSFCLPFSVFICATIFNQIECSVYNLPGDSWLIKNSSRASRQMA